MSASRNEATGGVLANVKGDADKYAEGWDRIFGKQPAPEVPLVVAPHAPAFLSEGDPRAAELGLTAIYSSTPGVALIKDYSRIRVLGTQDEVDEVNSVDYRRVWRIGDACPWHKFTPLTPPKS